MLETFAATLQCESLADVVLQGRGHPTVAAKKRRKRPPTAPAEERGSSDDYSELQGLPAPAR